MPIQPHNPESITIYNSVESASGYIPEGTLLSDLIAELQQHAESLSDEDAQNLLFSTITATIGVYFEREKVLSYPAQTDQMQRREMRKNHQDLQMYVERADFYDYLYALFLGYAHELD